MTRDDIIRMAREAGCHKASHPRSPWSVPQETLERFFRLAYEAGAAAAIEKTHAESERFKLSAAMWRNKAYELGGTPLPWDADKKIKEAIAAERNRIADALQRQASIMSDHFEVKYLMELATELRRRAHAISFQ